MDLTMQDSSRNQQDSNHENLCDDDHLFNPNNLTKLFKWGEINEALQSIGLVARPLKRSDYNSGYLELLSELTHVGTVTELEFTQRFNLMQNINKGHEHYVVVVVEDTKTKRIVGASTLFIELKFIHKCAIRGRLEDVAVLKAYRSKKIGELVVKIIVSLAREVYKCYKLSLDCTDELMRFYAKNSFVKGSNMLCIRFDS